MKIFTPTILDWYEEHKRDLPWRNTKDPYKIWLSEIILQQTRVVQGLPYYEKFCELFPRITHLAQATEQEVMKAWQGLGYYSRARNLHKCAKTIVDTYDGRFPATYEEILKLPGVGPYTAAAIASFAFNEVVAVVDGNVYRVLSRYFGIEEDISKGKGQKYFREWANECISPENPATYNQAVMEFGAKQCSPGKPNCTACPLVETCIAHRENKIDQLPVKSAKTKTKNLFFHYYILRFQDQVYFQKRDQGFWNQLYEFYLIETKQNEQSPAVFSKTINEFPYSIGPHSAQYTHILSHRIIHSNFQEIWVNEEGYNYIEKNWKGNFVSQEEMKHLPHPVLIEKYLSKDLIRP